MALLQLGRRIESQLFATILNYSPDQSLSFWLKKYFNDAVFSKVFCTKFGPQNDFLVRQALYHVKG